MARWRVLVILAAVLLLPVVGESPASAAQTITVCPSGCAYQTIQGAINAASSGATIKIAAGTYDEHLTIPGASGASSLTLQGAGAGNTVMDGTNNGTDVNVNSGAVTIRNVTIKNGNAYPYGGGIYNDSGSTVALYDSTLSGNTAYDGGAIFNGYQSTLTVDNSTVSGNNSTGGSIWNNGTVTLTNSTVSGNKSNGDGGAIYSVFAKLTLNDSKVSNNSALSGGGIFNDFGSVLTLNKSVLSGNTAVYYGGGIYNGWNITMNNSTVSSNTAGYGGGGVNGGGVTLNNSAIKNNQPDNCENTTGC